MSEQIDNVETVIDADDSLEAESVSAGEHRHHHHHHHHHHHRHSKKHSSTNKKSNKLLSFIKKNRSILINILSCTVSLVLLIVLATKYDNSKADKTNSDSVEVTQTTVGIETSVYLEEVPLVNQAIISYMDKDNDKTAHEVYGLFDGYNNNLNEGLPLHFTYRVKSLPSNISVTNAVLEISKDINYKNNRQYELDAVSASIDIYHLETGVKYYYRIKLTLSDENVISTCGEFKTVNSPRILSIDGAANVRDIGGWETTNGTKIPQGIFYRGSELDGAVESKYKVTEAGKNDMLATLGIKFDMDLRSESENKTGVNALGENVEHKYYPIDAYSGVFEPDNREVIRSIFSDLADKNNYPVYIHCTYGNDRTGTICYLLEALLGMSEEDLYKEYELSAFTESYVNIEKFASFVTRIEMLEGNTIQEKVEGYLLSVGVTADEIASIKEIFIEAK